MPPKRSTSNSRAVRDAAAARAARAARLREPEPEPEPEPTADSESQSARTPRAADPWAALGDALRSPRSPGSDEQAGGASSDDKDSDDDDLFDTTQRRGRRLLSIEAVDFEAGGAERTGSQRARRYHCLWEMNGLVLKYRQRTWETLDDLWDRGEDVRELMRQ
jgi:hypothetical protein